MQCSFVIYAQPAVAAILVGGGIARMSRYSLVSALLIIQSLVGCGGKVGVTNNPTAGALQIGPSSLPSATVGTAYSAIVTASGGLTPYTFAITGGGLPTGLSLNSSTGVISGTPTQEGSSSFTVHVTDGSTAQLSGNQSFSIIVSPTALDAYGGR